MVHTFQIKIAAFHGSSGSPMLNELREVVGVLIQGQTDYKVYLVREKILCWKLPEKNVIKACAITKEEIKKFGYEACQRIDSIKEFIEPNLKE